MLINIMMAVFATGLFILQIWWIAGLESTLKAEKAKSHEQFLYLSKKIEGLERVMNHRSTLFWDLVETLGYNHEHTPEKNRFMKRRKK